MGNTRRRRRQAPAASRRRASSPGALAAPAAPREQAAPAKVPAPRLGPGTPLPRSTRERMEDAFGHDFAEVRIHADDAAGVLARAHEAKAFTLGRDLVFSPGAYRPGTASGDRRLAHELAHVVQQGSARPTGARIQPGPSRPDEPAEREAEAAADAFARGEPIHITPGARAATVRDRIMREFQFEGKVYGDSDLRDGLPALYSSTPPAPDERPIPPLGDIEAAPIPRDPEVHGGRRFGVIDDDRGASAAEATSRRVSLRALARRDHDPAAYLAARARAEVSAPANEARSRAKGDRVTELAGAQPGAPSRARVEASGDVQTRRGALDLGTLDDLEQRALDYQTDKTGDIDAYGDALVSEVGKQVAEVTNKFAELDSAPLVTPGPAPAPALVTPAAPETPDPALGAAVPPPVPAPALDASEYLDDANDHVRACGIDPAELELAIEHPITELAEHARALSEAVVGAGPRIRAHEADNLARTGADLGALAQRSERLASDERGRGLAAIAGVRDGLRRGEEQLREGVSASMEARHFSVSAAVAGERETLGAARINQFNSDNQAKLQTLAAEILAELAKPEHHNPDGSLRADTPPSAIQAPYANYRTELGELVDGNPSGGIADECVAVAETCRGYLRLAGIDLHAAVAGLPESLASAAATRELELVAAALGLERGVARVEAETLAATEARRTRSLSETAQELGRVSVENELSRDQTTLYTDEITDRAGRFVDLMVDLSKLGVAAFRDAADSQLRASLREQLWRVSEAEFRAWAIASLPTFVDALELPKAWLERLESIEGVELAQLVDEAWSSTSAIAGPVTEHVVGVLGDAVRIQAEAVFETLEAVEAKMAVLDALLARGEAFAEFAERVAVPGQGGGALALTLAEAIAGGLGEFLDEVGADPIRAMVASALAGPSKDALEALIADAAGGDAAGLDPELGAQGLGGADAAAAFAARRGSRRERARGSEPNEADPHEQPPRERAPLAAPEALAPTPAPPGVLELTALVETEVPAVEAAPRPAPGVAALVGEGVDGLTDAFVAAPPSHKAWTYASLAAGLDERASASTSALCDGVPAFEQVMGGEREMGELDRDLLRPELAPVVPIAPAPAPMPVAEELVAPTPDSPAFEENDGLLAWFGGLFGGDDADKAADIADSIDSVASIDQSVVTSPGPNPAVPLEGATDPALIDGQASAGMQQASDAFVGASATVLDGPGPELVQPLVLDEAVELDALAHAPLAQAGATEVAGIETFLSLGVSADVQAAFDQQRGAAMAASLDDAQRQVGAAVETRDLDWDAELVQAQAQNQVLVDAAQDEQDRAISDQRQRIQDERQRTLDEQAREVDEVRLEAEGLRARQREDIEARVATDEATIASEYAAAEAAAEAEVAAGEQAAEAEKEQAWTSAQDQGWWEQAKTWLEDALDALVAAVDEIIAGVRVIVDGLLDAARDAAVAVIELAAEFIKTAIEAYGVLLVGLVDGLLGEVFPELARALTEAIDEAVGLALAAVDAVATTLIEGVDALVAATRAKLEQLVAAFTTAVEFALGLLGAALAGDWEGVVQQLLEAALMLAGIDPGAFYALVGQLEDTLDLIVADPGAFVNNLFGAVALGFNLFVENIGAHLQQGFFEWVAGPLGELGVSLPASWDIWSIFGVVMQILGLTRDGIRGLIVEELGDTAGAIFDHVWGYTEALITGGWQGLWDQVKSDLSDLWGVVVDGIKGWLIERVVTQATLKLLALIDPTGISQLVQVVTSAWQIYEFLRDNLQRLVGIAQTVVETMSEIARGVLETAAGMVEGALADLIPVALDLLANLLGIGDFTAKVQDQIERVRERVREALRGLIRRVKGTFRGDADPPSEAGEGDGASEDEQLGQRLTVSAGDERHEIWIDVDGDAATIMAASDPGPIERLLASFEQRATSDDSDAVSSLIEAVRELVAGLDRRADRALDDDLDPGAAARERAEVEGLLSDLVAEIREIMIDLGASTNTPEGRVALFMLCSDHRPTRRASALFESEADPPVEYLVSSPAPWRKADYKAFFASAQDGVEITDGMWQRDRAAALDARGPVRVAKLGASQYVLVQTQDAVSEVRFIPGRQAGAGVAGLHPIERYPEPELGDHPMSSDKGRDRQVLEDGLPRVPDGTSRESHHVPAKAFAKFLNEEIAGVVDDLRGNPAASEARAAFERRTITLSSDGNNLSAILVHRLTHRLAPSAIHRASMRDAIDAKTAEVHAEAQADLRTNREYAQLKIRAAAAPLRVVLGSGEIATNPGEAQWKAFIARAKAEVEELRASERAQALVGHDATVVSAALTTIDGELDQQAASSEAVDAGERARLSTELESVAKGTIDLAYQAALGQGVGAVLAALEGSEVDGPPAKHPSRRDIEKGVQANTLWKKLRGLS